jgi:eukaryotic-like serine/threonine-protein kinase
VIVASGNLLYTINTSILLIVHLSGYITFGLNSRRYQMALKLSFRPLVYLFLGLIFLLPPLSNKSSAKSDQERTSIYLPFTARDYSRFPGMVFISAGEFIMGCDHYNIERNERGINEMPLHSVFISDYYIDIHEVTNLKYSECVGAGACSPPISYSSYTRASYYDDPLYANYPVVYVDWNAADAYCNWAGKRLPTEAEWEKAARGSDYRIYPWGNEPINCSLANHYSDNGFCEGDTTEVGSYTLGASPYGVMDMAGNVKEWVSDWYQVDYYGVSPHNNPLGPETGVVKIFRGGSFASAGWLNRTAIRDHPT